MVCTSSVPIDALFGRYLVNSFEELLWKIFSVENSKGHNPRKIHILNCVNNMHKFFPCWCFVLGFIKLWWIVFKKYTGQKFPIKNFKGQVSYPCWCFVPSFIELWCRVLENFYRQETWWSDGRTELNFISPFCLIGWDKNIL